MIVAAGRAALEEWYNGSLSREEVARFATRGVNALLKAFVADERAQVARPWALPRCVAPVGGLITHASNLFRYARFHMGDGTTPEGVRLLTPASLEAMHTPFVPAGGLEWSDVGSWDSLFELLLPDEHGNVAVNSELMSINSCDTLVYSTGKKLVAAIGVEDLIVIDSDDAMLVCRRDQAQQVRQVIENLKKSKRNEYL